MQCDSPGHPIPLEPEINIVFTLGLASRNVYHEDSALFKPPPRSFLAEGGPDEEEGCLPV